MFSILRLQLKCILKIYLSPERITTALKKYDYDKCLNVYEKGKNYSLLVGV